MAAKKFPNEAVRFLHRQIIDKGAGAQFDQAIDNFKNQSNKTVGGMQVVRTEIDGKRVEIWCELSHSNPEEVTISKIEYE